MGILYNTLLIFILLSFLEGRKNVKVLHLIKTQDIGHNPR